MDWFSFCNSGARVLGDSQVSQDYGWQQTQSSSSSNFGWRGWEWWSNYSVKIRLGWSK